MFYDIEMRKSNYYTSYRLEKSVDDTFSKLVIKKMLYSLGEKAWNPRHEACRIKQWKYY